MNKLLSAINFTMAGSLFAMTLYVEGEWWIGIVISANLLSGMYGLMRD